MFLDNLNSIEEVYEMQATFPEEITCFHNSKEKLTQILSVDESNITDENEKYEDLNDNDEDSPPVVMNVKSIYDFNNREDMTDDME
jgi:hypothetical protein